MEPQPGTDETPRTDPTGQSFLSYRQEREGPEGKTDADLLIRAQRDLGIPTWQDLRNLDGGHMEESIEEVLQDPRIANVLLWITPEIADSHFVREVEIPRILERERRKDDFFVHVVAAEGLTYKGAAATLEGALGVHDLTAFKIQELSTDRLTLPGARAVAEQILRRRLQAIDRRAPEGAPLQVRLLTRTDEGFVPGRALVLSWSEHFKHRRARPDAWQEHLLPALRSVRRALEERAPGRKLDLRGIASLSSALALGSTFPALRGIECVWHQYSSNAPEQPWHQGAPREESGFTSSLTRGPIDAEDLAVLISVTEDVAVAFGRSRPDLPRFRGVVTIAPRLGPGERFKRFEIQTPGQARDIVEITVEAIREARRTLQTRRIHLFPAIPLGLAFLLGQRLNTLGPVQTYEIEEPDNVGRYHPEVLLRPEELG